MWRQGGLVATVSSQHPWSVLCGIFISFSCLCVLHPTVQSELLLFIPQPSLNVHSCWTFSRIHRDNMPWWNLVALIVVRHFSQRDCHTILFYAQSCPPSALICPLGCSQPLADLQSFRRQQLECALHHSRVWKECMDFISTDTATSSAPVLRHFKHCN